MTNSGKKIKKIVPYFTIYFLKRLLKHVSAHVNDEYFIYAAVHSTVGCAQTERKKPPIIRIRGCVHEALKIYILEVVKS